MNSEASIKNIEKKFTKIKFNKNLFIKNSRRDKEKTKFNNKSKIASLDIENFFIYKRINNAASIYPSKNFQKDFERSQTYKTNICKLPKINYKKYLKPPLNAKEAQKKLYKLNYDNANFSTVNTNISLTSNNKYYFNYEELEELDSILLYIYLNLRNTVPLIKKARIVAFKYENENKTEVQLFKTLKENGLKDKSKILIEYE